jgi:hypothetical protein
MQRLIKVIPLVLACILGFAFFHFAGKDPPHISAKTLALLQARHPHGEVALVYMGDSLQVEPYGKLDKREFRVQAFKPGTVEFYDAAGKSVMKFFVEPGDVVITEPKHKQIEAYDFEPYEWIE